MATSPRILIVAGGTGGHISPGVALLAGWTRRGFSGKLLSSTRNRENPDLRALEEETQDQVEWHEPPVFPNWRRPWTWPVFLLKFLRARRKARQVIRAWQPDLVVAMGGYTCAPTLTLLRGRLFSLRDSDGNPLPYYLCEQNCVPGLVTRLFARRARRVFFSFPPDPNHPAAQKLLEILPAEKRPEPGNPPRPEIARAALQGDHPTDLHSPRILVMGGSQGARQLNQMVTGLFGTDTAGEKPQIHWKLTLLTGHLTFLETCRQLEKKLGPGRPAPEREDQIFFGDQNQLDVRAYETDMAGLYQQADIIVARSGAGLLSEASLFGLPMILVPYPFAADNHQAANAEYAQRAGAALVLNGRDISSRKLLESLKEILSEKNLESFRRASRKLGRPAAAREILDRLVDDLSGTPGLKE